MFESHISAEESIGQFVGLIDVTLTSVVHVSQIGKDLKKQMENVKVTQL